jgi:hypothetical protein
MISVIEVYNTLRDLCNKEQKGFVTPEVFNSFADVCQQNIFNEMFQEISVAKRARRAGIDPGRDKSFGKQIEEDLSQFISTALLRPGTFGEADSIQISPRLFDSGEPMGSETNSPYNWASTTYEKIGNISKIISIEAYDRSGVGRQIELVYDPEKISRILRSNLSGPTVEHPVALIAENIQVFPQGATTLINLTYYRIPKSLYAASIDGVVNKGEIDYESSPAFSAQVIDAGTGLVIPNVVNCRDFELPPHYKNELIVELAKMIGVRLRDTFLTQYSIAQEQAE